MATKQKRQRRYRWLVNGRGTFPDDMLRYDHCEVVAGERGPVPAPVWLMQASRTVTIEGPRGPTVDRWASFGWHAGSVEVIS